MASPKEIMKPGLGKQLRLVWELVKNPRVPILLKLLPIGAIAYLICPGDLLPANPLDDGVVIWAGFTLFVELAPDDVVREILEKLTPPSDDVE